MNGNRAVSWTIAGLFVTSVAGWGTAWKYWSAASEANNGHGISARSSAQRGERRDPQRSLGSLIENPRSARLFSEITEISGAAEAGTVNAKLVAACRAALTDPDPQSRSRDFALLLTQMRAEDGPGLHLLFLELHAQGKPLAEYAAFATRWGEVDGKGAYDFLANEIPQRMPDRDLISIARGWGAKDPQAALAWMVENEELAHRFGGRGKVFEGWVRNDSDGATAWLLLQEPTGELIGCVAGAMPEQLHSKDLMTAMKWLADLPDDGVMAIASMEGWRSAMNDLNELSYKSASDVWSVVRDEPWAGFDQFARLADQTSRTRLASAGMSGFLDELAQSWPADEVASRFQQWSAAEPERVSEWLNGAPPSALRDAAIRGMVETLEKSDPAAAREWRNELDN